MQQIPDMGELIRMAQTPAGRKLISLLQKQSGSQLQQAVTSAAAGDYTQAREILSVLLSSPDAQALLQELEEQRGVNWKTNWARSCPIPNSCSRSQPWPRRWDSHRPNSLRLRQRKLLLPFRILPCCRVYPG